MYKPLADSTLLRMPKKEIIELLRTAEHNAKVSQEWVSQQAKNLKDWGPVVHAWWGTGRFNLETGNYEEQCTRCRNFSKEYDKPYCPNCGAKMDGGDSDVRIAD